VQFGGCRCRLPRVSAISPPLHSRISSLQKGLRHEGDWEATQEPGAWTARVPVRILGSVARKSRPGSKGGNQWRTGDVRDCSLWNRGKRCGGPFVTCRYGPGSKAGNTRRTGNVSCRVAAQRANVSPGDSRDRLALETLCGKALQTCRHNDPRDSKAGRSLTLPARQRLCFQPCQCGTIS